jgi:hypothetical protein
MKPFWDSKWDMGYIPKTFTLTNYVSTSIGHQMVREVYSVFKH